MHRIQSKSSLTPSSGILAGILMVSAVLVPTGAGAQSISRVDAARLSCSALKGIIKDRGAVIVRSRSLQSNMMLSDRFVSRRGFCSHNEITRPQPVATADSNECYLKLCTERQNSKPGR